MAKAQTSEAVENVPVKLSGAIQRQGSIVPFDCCSYVGFPYSCRDKPKSDTFAFQALVRRTFLAARSRCTTPFDARYSMPAATSAHQRTRAFKVNFESSGKAN